MQYYYNSRDLECKKPFGAVKDNEKIEFTFFARNGVFVHKVFLVLTKDEEDPVYYEMGFESQEEAQSIFKLELKIDDPALYWYYFDVVTELGNVKLFKGDDNNACEYASDLYQLTVYSHEFKTPEFIEGGIIYHIFVDRFNKGLDADAVFEKQGVLKKWDEDVTVVDSDGVFRANDFFGGNFQGIIDRLDYLKHLGVTLIYLSPIFKSSSNHRYDTGDYLQLDELLGTEEKFKELIAKAKQRGMEVMLDGVFNHTGADSLYFNKFGNYPSVGAYQSKHSPYYNWYSFSHFPDRYNCWWGITVTPTLNKPCKGYENLILGEGGVIEKYMDMGVKAWRLDVVDELNSEFVIALRKAIKSKDKDALIIGEVWEDASNKMSYGTRRQYFQGEQLDGVMNYPFKEAVLEFVFTGNKEAFSRKVGEIVENYPAPALNAAMNIVGTHDTWRILNVCADLNVNAKDKSAKRLVRIDRRTAENCLGRLTIAVVLQFTLPGVPSIYYGDERGLDGYDDPLNRRTMPWDTNNEDIFALYEKITSIRRNYKEFFCGKICFIDNDGLLVYRRYNKDAYLSVVVNNGTQLCNLPLENDCIDLLTGEHYNKGDNLVKTHKVLILVAKNNFKKL